MSELKGTLLGIILVLVLFGTISTCMISSFDKMTKSVEDQVTETIGELDED